MFCVKNCPVGLRRNTPGPTRIVRFECLEEGDRVLLIEGTHMRSPMRVDTVCKDEKRIVSCYFILFGGLHLCLALATLHPL